jgi:flavodoxin
MKTIVLYSSKYGTTRKIADKLKEALQSCRTLIIVDVQEFQDIDIIQKCDNLIFITPTYGCEELHESMENFLINTPIFNKDYTVIETGNYYGYDDFTFGAKKIINNFLQQKQCKLFCECLSLDTYPRIDWEHLTKWLEYLKLYVR